MNDTTVGHVARTLRIRHGWRQEDLARRARVSVSTVARVERDLVGGIALDRTRRVLAAAGARFDTTVRWQGGELDRLLRARHSAMHELVARRFVDLAEWLAVPEVSFSIFGERGVIDLVAWHAASRTLLIVELKTEIVDVNELMAKADQRRRLAPRIVAERGWRPTTIAVWVAVALSRTNRRRFAAHRTVLRNAFPHDGREVSAWLRRPSGSLSALSFVTNGQELPPGTALASPKRVRRRRPRSAPAGQS